LLGCFEASEGSSNTWNAFDNWRTTSSELKTGLHAG
jgi:hypothetical protein